MQKHMIYYALASLITRIQEWVREHTTILAAGEGIIDPLRHCDLTSDGR